MNERSMKKILLVTLVLAAMVLSGFSVMSGNAAAAAPKVSAANNGNLVVAFQNDISNLNIFDPTTNSVWKFDALGWAFESLYSYTPDLIPYPNLALSATPDATGLNVTVQLRHNVTFQDGQPMTAEDVVFSYQTLYWDPQYKTSLQCLYWPTPKWPRWDGNGTSHIGVVATGKYTVVFHLYQPYPLFYQVTLGNTIIPEHIWVKHLVSAGTGDSNDMTIDTSWNDPGATIGTGAFKFVEWKPGNYVKIEVYKNYWGKGLSTPWRGKNWPWYPQYVRTITFRIYNTLDTAVLALKRGEVQFIDWSLPPGYYNQLKTDPNIGATIVNDQGFFYLAFNMRKEPMNDLAFRTAVAHCINKDYIVTTLMQGYGTKGTVPISITSGAYVNTSAIPPGFDLNAAQQVLDQAGYKVGSDGWRHAPDGSPIKETILTPPKDYDPIRAEAGIMIQANLQRVKLNIQSIPTNFDTIVSKAFVQVQFDMYILGWGVGAFPETYLEDFFASWNAAPVGYNTPGYHNPKVDKLLIEIRTDMNTQDRINKIKEIEGILVHDLPYDTLYYRKNIMAYRQDMWQGWVAAYGTIWNGFSLGVLHPPTSGGGGGGGGGGHHPGPITNITGTTLTGVVPHMYVPDVAYAGHSINGAFYVTDANGLPIKDVNVAIYASNGVWANGTTGNSGGFTFSVPLKFQEYGKPITLTYSFSVNMNGHSYNFTGSKEVMVYLPKSVAKIKLSIDKPILTPGASATITAKVTDLYAHPLAGVNVTILTEETSGSITPYNVTNSEGIATFHYTAPTMVTNINMVDIVKAQIKVNNTILTNLQTATLFVPIQSSGSSWYKVMIDHVSSYGITAGQSTQVTVKVVDINGNPVANHKVYMAAYYSNATDPNWYGEQLVPAWGITMDSNEKTTDSNGEATFTITANENANIPVILKAYTQDTYMAYDTVQIYVGNDTGFDPYIGAWTGLYAMDMQLNKVTAGNGQQVQVTMTVYNAATGAPLANAPVFMAVFGTDYGFGADWANNAGTYVWWAGQSVIWGTTDANGQFSYTLNTSALRADQPIYVSGWMDAYGYGFNAIYTGLGFDFPYLFGVKDGFILQRAPIMGISNIMVNEFYLSDTINTTMMTLKVVDIHGPLAGVTVDASWSLGTYKNSTEVTTNAQGIAQFNITIKPTVADSIVSVSIMLSSPDHAMNLNYEYYIPFLTGTSALSKVSVFDCLKVMAQSPSTYTDMVPYKGKAVIRMQLVGGLEGTPLAGEKVTISVPAGSVDQATKVTNANGIVVFNYTAPDLLLPAHYVFEVSAQSGAKYYFGVEVGGKYNNTQEIANTINQLNQKIADQSSQIQDLQNKYNNLNTEYKNLQDKYNSLQTNYTNLGKQKDQAVTMQYVWLSLFIIMIIIAIVMYYAGKKSGAKSAPSEEEGTEEEIEEEEEPTEEIEEETEEGSEEETSEEENTEE